MREELTQERLKELLHYDPETGVFVWRVDRGLKCNKGLEAGSTTRLYKVININGRKYPAHHLAWLYCFGKLPVEYLDHIDGDTANNRINNLREASLAENSKNKGRYSNSSSGYKGVFAVRLQDSVKWKALIQSDCQQIYLGLFDCPREAAHSYNVAAIRLHGEFARLNPI